MDGLSHGREPCCRFDRFFGLLFGLLYLFIHMKGIDVKELGYNAIRLSKVVLVLIFYICHRWIVALGHGMVWEKFCPSGINAWEQMGEQEKEKQELWWCDGVSILILVLLVSRSCVVVLGSGASSYSL